MNEKKSRMHVVEGNKTEWDKKQYDRIAIVTKKTANTRKRINAAAKKANISAQQYLLNAIENRLTLDGYPAPAEKEETPQE